MNDQALPDFESTSLPAEPTPRKPRPRPQRKRPAKKKARAAPKPVKRVPKKRRVRKTQVVPLGVTPGVDAVWSGRSSEALGMLLQLPVAARKLVITVAQALTK